MKSYSAANVAESTLWTQNSHTIMLRSHGIRQTERDTGWTEREKQTERSEKTSEYVCYGDVVLILCIILFNYYS